MPYIKSNEDRQYIDELVKKFISGSTWASGKVRYAGNLNYFLFKLCKELVGKYPSYKEYRNFMGELEAAKLEIYRRQVAPYEDKKIKENGDVE